MKENKQNTNFVCQEKVCATCNNTIYFGDPNFDDSKVIWEEGKFFCDFECMDKWGGVSKKMIDPLVEEMVPFTCSWKLDEEQFKVVKDILETLQDIKRTLWDIERRR